MKGGTDNIANGNYLTSEGKQGDDAWSTRAVWCKMYGKMGNDSVSIAIIDHPDQSKLSHFLACAGLRFICGQSIGRKNIYKWKKRKESSVEKRRISSILL